jgi:uncharacterized protein (TIGR00730 family)
MNSENNKRVCVFCASSSQCDQIYFEAADELGKQLAINGYTIVYGGGGVGLMGALADGAMSAGGKVVGIIPKFMDELEWGHKGITELRLVEDIHERKRLLIEQVEAIIALPGGCGTFEELFEALTLKRLGLHFNKIIMINTKGYFNSCIDLLELSIKEKFMDPRHRLMWTVIEEPRQIIDAINNAPGWFPDAQSFATI